MKDVKIIDNFLPENEFKILYNNLTDPLFPWYINQVINNDYNHELLVDPIDNYQFCHHFYYPVYQGKSPKVCQGINCLDPILKRLDCISLARIKANCLPRTSSIIRHGYRCTQTPEECRFVIGTSPRSRICKYRELRS